MSVVNIYEAKTRLSQLVAEAEAGATVIIARNGTPVAQLTAVAARVERVPGALRGAVDVAADFDDWSVEDERDWFGTERIELTDPPES